MPEALADLLIRRGFDTEGAAKSFLRPSLDALTDPRELKDLPEAVDLIMGQIRDHRPIMVHGDYDVDGQCATALLTRVLRAAGAEVIPFVPSRLRDGYDLGPAGVSAAAEGGAGLIVTCDCGTTAHQAVAEAKRRGLRVIVTDHHLASAMPPADAVINPNRLDCPSSSKELCGTGVAFKLAQGVVHALGLPENLPLHFLDLVALATVADLVPLVGENRPLVRFGLRTLARSRWPGIRALVQSAGLQGRQLRAGHIGFILAPRLNAVGRIGEAMEGLQLLLCDDEREALRRAQALETINAERQEMDREILVQAVQHIEESVDLDEQFGLVLARDDWHPGVIGIVASRIVERFARPTVMIGLEGDEGRGSGRSIPGFDLHGALRACGEYLVKYGGHKMAAGLTVARGEIDAFRRAFNEAVRAELSLEDLVHTRRIDAVVPVSTLDHTLERLLRHFEPCGVGNPGPVFAVRRAEARNARTVGADHLKFTLADATGRLAAIGFGLAERVETEWLNRPVDVAFRLEENDWQGLVSLQARVIDLKPSDP